MKLSPTSFFAMMASMMLISGSSATDISNSLDKDEKLYAPGYIGAGPYQFGLKEDGDLYLSGAFEKTIFASGGKGAKLVMQADGNLVLYNKNHHAVYATNTYSHGAKTKVDDKTGYVNIISTNGETLKTFKPAGCMGFDLTKKHRLYAGEFLCLGNIRFGLTHEGKVACGMNLNFKKIAGPAEYMEMQSDGNLVAYKKGHPVWATHTAGKDGAALIVRDTRAIVYKGGVPSGHLDSDKKAWQMDCSM